MDAEKIWNLMCEDVRRKISAKNCVENGKNCPFCEVRIKQDWDELSPQGKDHVTQGLLNMSESKTNE